MPRQPAIPLEIQAEAQKIVDDFNRKKLKKVVPILSVILGGRPNHSYAARFRENFFTLIGLNEENLHPSAGSPGPAQWTNGNLRSTNTPTTATTLMNGFSREVKKLMAP